MIQTQTFSARILLHSGNGRGSMHEATEDYWFIADAFYQRNRLINLTVEEAFERINNHLHLLGLRNLTNRPIAYALLNLKSNLIHGRRPGY